ncbi:type III secretion system inner membrane ring subunit SctD [Chitinimonas sp. BJB300]|uniref:type III secretion system inner membrane ring subunit SctD n=1 Tax=Chitinimonas sp. BJB300 TaxID=1559339 RepID=UPI000C0ECDC5|nr:type III secretion system inner membrane ring subunit SctD [Chitinimonas sp. BJB300]PHV11493.1 EscD/YscD/HrpQ family type III secretion system inner membrane ring protein [Chitinimonas sp. BJB300]TSJ88511.1 EscD/YscD/HrpQ family type III secretion system inner membrane ring protein [Chitinimonas sp. BJB300]
MNARYKLKLLNGPLAGRELRLPAGLFTLGSGDSDLSLPLEGGIQASLKIEAEQIVLDSPSPCWVAGTSILPGPLPLGKVIDLAGFCFVLGTTDTKLDTRRIPSRHRPAPLGLFAAVTGVVALVCVGIALVPQPVPAAPTPQEWLPTALKPMPNLKTRWSKSNELIMDGRCADSAQLTDLMTRLHAVGVKVVREAVCDDELRQSVQALATGYGYRYIDVRISEKGEALIDGAIRNDEHFPALAKALNQLPGLHGWQLSDQGNEEFAALQQRLRQGNLFEGLSAQRDDRGWLLSGQLDKPRQTAIDHLLRTLNAVPGRRYSLRYVNAASVIKPADYLPAAIRALGGNEQSPYLELANGMRLQPGSQVLQGMRIVALSSAGVSLANDQQLVFLPLNT